MTISISISGIINKKKGINIELEIVSLPGGQSYREKLPLAIMSGNIPDIIYDQYGYDKVMSDQGILEDLTNYVSKSSALQGAMWKHNKETQTDTPTETRLGLGFLCLGCLAQDCVSALSVLSVRMACADGKPFCLCGRTKLSNLSPSLQQTFSASENESGTVWESGLFPFL